MPLFNKLKFKCIQIYNFMHEPMKKCLLYQWLKVLKLKVKNSQEDTEHQLFKLGFMKMVELFKQQQVIILVKISQKCLEFNLKIKKNKKN